MRSQRAPRLAAHLWHAGGFTPGTRMMPALVLCECSSRATIGSALQSDQAVIDPWHCKANHVLCTAAPAAQHIYNIVGATVPKSAKRSQPSRAVTWTGGGTVVTLLTSSSMMPLKLLIEEKKVAFHGVVHMCALQLRLRCVHQTWCSSSTCACGPATWLAVSISTVVCNASFQFDMLHPLQVASLFW